MCWWQSTACLQLPPRPAAALLCFQPAQTLKTIPTCAADAVPAAAALACHPALLPTQLGVSPRAPQTLCRGGDTDTNAAIVGGLMGALHGTSVIPAFMLQPVESYSGGRCPADLRPSCLRGLAQQLYREARAAGGRAQPAGGRLPGAAAKSKRSAPGAAAAGGQQAGGSSRAQAALSPARAAGLAVLQRVQPAGGVSLEEPDAAPQQEQQEQQQPAARKRPQRQPPMGASGGGGGITDVVDLTGEDVAEEEGGPPALPPAKKRHTATDDY